MRSGTSVVEKAVGYVRIWKFVECLSTRLSAINSAERR